MKKTNAMRILGQKKISFDIVTYQYDSENLSVEKIALDNNLELKQVYKTLVLKGDKTGAIVALVAGDNEVSLKKMAEASSNKKVAMVAVKDLQNLTGYVRGGCSPIGMKKKFDVFISEEAVELDKIYINAGTRGTLVGLSPNDLLEVVSGQYVDIV